MRPQSSSTGCNYSYSYSLEQTSMLWIVCHL